MDSNHGHPSTSSGIVTRSKSRLAAAAPQAAGYQGRGQQRLSQRQSVPQIPDGPLVISAGWGRTGTSSLKVRARSYQCLSLSMCLSTGLLCRLLPERSYQ